MHAVQPWITNIISKLEPSTDKTDFTVNSNLRGILKKFFHGQKCLGNIKNYVILLGDSTVFLAY